MKHFEVFRDILSDSKRLRKMIKKNSAEIDFNQQDDTGKTLLHLAAFVRDSKVTKLLLKKGVNPNIVDDKNNMPLKYYLINDNYKPAVLVIKSGKIDLNFASESGWTILHEAATNDDSEKYINLLHQFGADISQIDESGDTPLHCAVENNKIDNVKTLLKLNAPVNMVNSNNESPSDIAKRNGSNEILEMLESYI